MGTWPVRSRGRSSPVSARLSPTPSPTPLSCSTRSRPRWARIRLSRLQGRHRAGSRARRPLAGLGLSRPQGGFCRDRPRVAARVLGLMAEARDASARPLAVSADEFLRLHRLVELPRRPCDGQHHGLRRMTSGPALRRFAFAYGATFAILYVVARARGLALFTRLSLAWRRAAGYAPLGRDVADPAVEFLAPEMWWYGGPYPRRSARWPSASWPHRCPNARGARLRPEWLWLIPLIAMAACVDLAMPWLRRKGGRNAQQRDARLGLSQQSLWESRNSVLRFLSRPSYDP